MWATTVSSLTVTMNSSFNIGIDFGGVLSVHDVKDNQKSAEHRNTSINMPGAIENLLKLRSLNHKLFLISFCGKARAIETLQKLKSTLVSESERMFVADIFDEIYFVKNIAFKRHVCEFLKCHFMIDDRVDVLSNFKNYSCATLPILFGNHSEAFISAKNWQCVTKIIIETEFFEPENIQNIQNIDIFLHKL